MAIAGWVSGEGSTDGKKVVTDTVTYNAAIGAGSQGDVTVSEKGIALSSTHGGHRREVAPLVPRPVGEYHSLGAAVATEDGKRRGTSDGSGHSSRVASMPTARARRR